MGIFKIEYYAQLLISQNKHYNVNYSGQESYLV